MSLLSMFRGRGKAAAPGATAKKTSAAALPRIIIDRHQYQPEEFALGSFRIRPYDGDLIARQMFDFRIAFEIGEENIDFQCRGIVVRLDEEHGLVARYQSPQPFYQRKLQTFLQGGRGV
ncbi:hypothetical protein [Azospirillum sp. ST 5-10]|uniref:hypothetical protein n=1 Tax=unclassified Azospirillum TaxID=2630922 RepID=UPI003F4A7DD2